MMPNLYSASRRTPFFLLFIAGVLVLALCFGARRSDAQSLSQQDQDRLVDHVHSQLEGWGGGGALLSSATATLQQVLESNPQHVRAHIEMARVYVLGGYINYRNFQPGSLENADRQLQAAIRIDPSSADAHLQLGSVWYHRGYPEIAASTYAKAERLGTTSPWLDLGYFDVLADLGKWDEAAVRLRKLELRFAKEKNAERAVLREYYGRLIKLREHNGDLPGADKAFRKMLDVDPRFAWSHGNYAEFLLFRRDNADAAIVEANKALTIMDFGMGRWILGAAQYSKWAETKSMAPKKAMQYLALARVNASNTDTVMVRAAFSADAGPSIRRMVLALREAGVSLDARDEHGDTGLSLAVFWGRKESVRWLLEQGADLRAKDAMRRDMLSMALQQDHREVARLLVAHGADVNQTGYQSRSPLYVAALVGDPETVRMLIGLGAALDVGAPGATPLMGAARNNHHEVVRILIDAGADPTIGMKNGNSAADRARRDGHVELEAVLRQAEEAWIARRK